MRPVNLKQIGDPPRLVSVYGHRLTPSVAAAAARLLPKMEGPRIGGPVDRRRFYAAAGTQGVSVRHFLFQSGGLQIIANRVLLFFFYCAICQ